MSNAAVPGGPAALNLLKPGTAARLLTSQGPAIALKNADGTWSAPGIGNSLSAGELWRRAKSVTVLGERPAWSGHEALGA